MRLNSVIGLIAILSLAGCAVGRVKVETEGKVTCSGGYAILGGATGPCGITGGAISTGAADLAGKLLGQAMTFIPGVSSPNPETPDIVIKHQDAESEPEAVAPDPVLIQQLTPAPGYRNWKPEPAQTNDAADHETAEIKPWQHLDTITVEEYQALLDD